MLPNWAPTWSSLPPRCGGLFAAATVRANLSEWDLLNMEEREEERNRRVALAAKAVLKCPCGAVGVVLEEDMGNGTVSCPGCKTVYCALCGNDAHPGAECPPPSETLEWLSKRTKPCPNCHNRIEKNGGCDHMTCRPPGGCGHEFCWRCEMPYRGHRMGGPACKARERQLKEAAKAAKKK